MSFLPEDYQSPKSNSSYTKLEEGETRIRILTAPIIGWEDWKDKKPVRFKKSMKPATSIDPNKPVKHFWAFIVWNYKTERLEIFMCTKASIRNRLECLSKDQDWGDPYYYDIKITKIGQSVNTEYEVNPTPKKVLSEHIMNAFADKPTDLEELFSNGDPFAATEQFRTKGFWELEQPEAKKSSLMSKEQVDEIETKIEMHIALHDSGWRNQVLKACGKSSFAEIDSKLFDSIMKRVEAKIAMLEDTMEVPF
jgi:hypothetical protein